MLCRSSFNKKAPFIEVAPDNGAVDCQRIHAFLPLDRVNANHGRFAGEFDRSYNSIELRCIEIALELIPRFPFLDEQHGLALIEVREKAHGETTRRYARRLKDRSKRPQ